MGSELETENVFIQIREKLQKDGIKLWMKPYYDPESFESSPADLECLAKTYSTLLNLPQESCFSTISELQIYALEKLKQRKHFNATGYASLKIKLLNQEDGPQIFSKEILLSSIGSDLKAAVASSTDIPQDRLKLIAGGKVLRDLDSLASQGVQNGQQVLALTINSSLSELTAAENQAHELDAVKEDTKLLAADEFYLELEDQYGNPIEMPKKDRKALMIAMALHEKGRTALKKEDYAKALVFFLDADREFSQCNSQVLQSVDNYALLDLDIVWCYLCLQSVSHLPEAFNRLQRCEIAFRKTYGANLERLIAVKGTAGNEAALLLRLHLLQGIVLFHQNKRNEALDLLRKVEAELQHLKVDDNSIIALVELGYSDAEARLGLRVTNGDINSAANYLNENRNKRKEARKKALSEKILQREQMKYGKCADGTQFVNSNFVRMLVSMGFNKVAATTALQKCNNIISDSIQYIQDNPGPSKSRSQEFMSFISDLIPELEAAGFESSMAKRALQKHNGDIMKAAADLITNNGIIEPNGTDSVEEDTTSTDSTNIEQKKRKQEAFDRLAQDISIVDDDHLDLTLHQEEIFLQQYMSLLKD